MESKVAGLSSLVSHTGLCPKVQSYGASLAERTIQAEALGKFPSFAGLGAAGVWTAS